MEFELHVFNSQGSILNRKKAFSENISDSRVFHGLGWEEILLGNWLVNIRRQKQDSRGF